jgi:hypothetical protein
MEKNISDKLIPEKIEGKNNEVEESIICDSHEDAEKKFTDAVNKLLDINSWHQTVENSGASAEFRMFDRGGKSIKGNAKEGDYIRIDVPGPGPIAGSGFDWVCIEKIIDQRNADGENEMVGLKVRPCSDPASVDNDTAHFFTDEATSTFIIERTGKIVYSKYFGRNEVVNTETNTPDKIRNSLIGLAAKFGFSEIQWKSLMKGFLNENG